MEIMEAMNVDYNGTSSKLQRNYWLKKRKNQKRQGVAWTSAQMRHTSRRKRTHTYIQYGFVCEHSTYVVVTVRTQESEWISAKKICIVKK